MGRDFKYTCDFCGLAVAAEGSAESGFRPPENWMFIQKYVSGSALDGCVWLTSGHLCSECLPKPKERKPPEDTL